MNSQENQANGYSQLPKEEDYNNSIPQILEEEIDYDALANQDNSQKDLLGNGGSHPTIQPSSIADGGSRTASLSAKRNLKPSSGQNQYKQQQSKGRREPSPNYKQIQSKQVSSRGAIGSSLHPNERQDHHPIKQNDAQLKQSLAHQNVLSHNNPHTNSFVHHPSNTNSIVSAVAASNLVNRKHGSSQRQHNASNQPALAHNKQSYKDKFYELENIDYDEFDYMQRGIASQDDIRRNQKLEENNICGKTFDFSQKFEQQTIRYGDVLSINFDEVYQHQDSEGFKTEYHFKGIAYCNGVTKTKVEMLSRYFAENQRAFCNFKNCLFRVETCSRYQVTQKINMLKEKLEIKEQLAKQQQTINQQQKQQFAEADNQQDAKNDSNDFTLDQLRDKIKGLEEALLLENEDNSYLNTQKSGTKVLFGDLVVLRHLESGKYLSLNTKGTAEETGCFLCELMDLNESALVSLVPADRLRQNGQIIKYQDGFLLQNYSELTSNKQPLFMHVNVANLQTEQQQARLEVNGSSDITIFKAKLYQPHSYMTSIQDAEDSIFSGSVIRLFHKQTNGFLSIRQQNILSTLPSYPSHLTKEIDEFAKEQASLIQKYQQKDLLDGSRPQTQSKEQRDKPQEDSSKPKAEVENQINENEVTIEVDNKNNKKARYLWEIQKLKPYFASEVLWETFYRIKHVQTGLYLCLPSVDQVDGDTESQSLSLQPLRDSEEFLFKLEKDSKVQDSRAVNESICNLSFIKISRDADKYIQSTQKKKGQEPFKLENKKGVSKNQEQTFEEVKCTKGEKENHARVVFQIQLVTTKEAESIKQASLHMQSALDFFSFLNKFGVKEINQGEQQLDSTQKKEDSYDMAEVKSGELELKNVSLKFLSNVDDLRISLQHFQDLEDPSKYEMLQEYLAEQGVVELYVKLLELIFYKSVAYDKRYIYSRYSSLFEMSKLPTLQGYGQDDFKFMADRLPEVAESDEDDDEEAARLRTDGFGRTGQQFMNFDKTDSSKLKEKKQKSQLQLPQDDDEQQPSKQIKSPSSQEVPLGIQEQNVTTKPANENLQQRTNQNDQTKDKDAIPVDRPHSVVKKHISLISSRILDTLILMIKGNQEVGQILGKYDDILFQQLLGKNLKRADRIFKETYRLSRIGDTSGLFQSFLAMNEKRFSNFSNLGKWIDLVQSPKYVDAKAQNLTQQILFLKVISLMCQDEDGNGIFENQMLVYEKMFKSSSHVRTVRFGLLNLSQDKITTKIIPYIQFKLRNLPDDYNHFLQQNHYLESEVMKDTSVSCLDEEGNNYTPPISLLKILSGQKPLSIYSRYLSGVIMLITTIIKNGHWHGKAYAKKIGLNFSFIQYAIQMTTQTKRKVLLLRLITDLYVNNHASYGIYGFQNRSYYYQQIQPAQMFHKNLQLPQLPESEKSTGQIAEEAERAQVYKFLPELIYESLLISEDFNDDNKIQTKELYDNFEQQSSKENSNQLKLMIAALECGLNLIKCEKCNSAFVFKMIYVAAIIFQRPKKKTPESLASAQDKQLNTRRLFLFMNHCSKVKEHKEDMETFISTVLQILKAIGKIRTDHQIMVILKKFVSRRAENRLLVDNEMAAVVELANAQPILEERNRATQKGLKQITEAFLGFQEKMSNLFQFEVEADVDVFDNKFVDSLKNPLVEQEFHEVNQLFKNGNVRFSLRRLLLLLIFDRKKSIEHKKLAFEVLMSNFEMVNQLKSEMLKVELITDDVKEEYQSLQQERHKIINLIQEIVWYSFCVKNPESSTVWKDSIQNCITSIGKISEGLNQNSAKQRKKQEMLRSLDMPKLLIDCLIKDVRYNSTMHDKLFQEIMKFLFAFTLQNADNSKTLTSYLDFLTSLQEKGISNEKLITQIVKQLKNQDQETQLIEHIMKQVSKNNKETLENLLKSLITLSETSLLNKSNIFKKIIKSSLEKFILLQKEKRQTLVGVIKNYQIVIKNEKINQDNELLKNQNELVMATMTYRAHKSIVTLLASCSQNQVLSIPQLQKMAEYESMIELISAPTTPLLLRKKYLRLFLIIHLTDYEDITEERNFNLDKNLLKFFDQVLVKDLKNFPKFIHSLIKNPSDPEKYKEVIESKQEEIKKLQNDFEAEEKKKIEQENKARQNNKYPNRGVESNHHQTNSNVTAATPQDNIMFLDETDENEYWRYLSNYSNTTNRQDGLLHFIADFFNGVKWNISGVLRSKAKSILDTLTKMKSLLGKITFESIEMTEVVTTLVQNLELAMQAIIEQEKAQKSKNQKSTSQAVQNKKQKRGSKDPAAQKLSSDNLRNLNNLQNKGKVEKERRKSVFALVDPSKNDGASDKTTVPGGNGAGEQTAAAAISEDQQAERFFQIICEKMIEKDKGPTCLAKIFGLDQYDNMTLLSSTNFNKFMMRLVLQKEKKGSDNADQQNVMKFYSYIVHEMQLKQQDLDVDRFQNNNYGRSIPFSLFADLVFEYVQQKNEISLFSNVYDEQKLSELIYQNYVRYPKLQLEAHQKLGGFVRRIFDSSAECLNPMKDLNGIIKDITDQFPSLKSTNYEYLKLFFDNMIAGLQIPEQRLYILRVLNGLIVHLEQETKSELITEEEFKDSIEELNNVLKIMKDCMLPEHLLRYLDTNENEEVSLLSIQILNLLLNGLTQDIQEQLFNFIRENQEELKLAEYLESKISQYTLRVIQQKFDLIKEQTLQQNREYGNGSVNILTELDENKHQKILDIKSKRKQTLANFIDILRFIQLLCDNCHLGFQNFFRDQLTIQNDPSTSNILATADAETVENTSSFNVIITVAKSFMRLTGLFQELIFFDASPTPEQAQMDKEKQMPQKEKDFGLGALIWQFLAVLIDFLYGPCLLNQQLLSTWKMFLKSLDFYIVCDGVYFFSQTIFQESRFMLMEKATQLLLAIVENPNEPTSVQLYTNLESAIDFDKLQMIFIEVYKQKIFAIRGSLKIFQAQRRYRAANYSPKDLRIYPNRSLRDSDEQIFQVGFNLFVFLLAYKNLNPVIPQLRNTDGVYKSRIDKKLLKIKLKQKIEKDQISLAQRLFDEKHSMINRTNIFIKEHISYLISQNDDSIMQILNKIIIILDFLKTQRAFLKKQYEGIMTDKPFFKKTITSMQTSIQRGMKGCCRCFRSRRVANGEQDQKVQQEEKLLSMLDSNANAEGNSMSQIKSDKEKSRKFGSLGGALSNKIMKQIEKSSQYNIQSLKEKIQQDTEEAEQIKQKQEVDDDESEDEDFFGDNQQKIVTSEAQSEEERLSKFQLRMAVHFYQQFIAQIEIDYKGQLVRTMYRIPQKCVFFSQQSREEILYGQKTASLYDKLEDLFSKMSVILAEMKSNQRLARDSNLRFWASEYNFFLSYASFSIIVVINLLYLIFYEFDSDKEALSFKYEEARQTTLTLAIFQAVISFLTHLGYFGRFHGVYYQKHIDKDQSEKKEKYTSFKGCLGFADGQSVSRESKSIVETEVTNMRDKLKYFLKKRKRVRTFVNNLFYTVHVYFIGLNLDPRHAFNLVFFAISVGGIFYPLLFSLLLLEIIIQIPLLYNVIQAIVQNKRQILYTMLLLLVIVYIYAFIALISFRDTYENADGGDQVSINNYCYNLGFCFTSTLNNGIRSGGGIGDTLAQLSIEENNYWGRYAFDLTFYILIIVLLLNLIFGIIIDAFAAMRDARNEIEKEVQEKCYICGIESNVFESKKKSFQDHIQREHNVYSYIYYIIYLSRKPTNECTGVEKYVQGLLSQEDPTFFPIGKALALVDKDGESNLPSSESS